MLTVAATRHCDTSGDDFLGCDMKRTRRPRGRSLGAGYMWVLMVGGVRCRDMQRLSLGHDVVGRSLSRVQAVAGTRHWDACGDDHWDPGVRLTMTMTSTKMVLHRASVTSEFEYTMLSL